VTSSRIQLLGELYDGAFGRTLLMEPQSVETVRWLRRTFLEVAESGAPIDLAQLEGVRLRNVSHLELRLVEKPPVKRLTIIEPDKLVWRSTREEWTTAAELLRPLAEGAHGHQYLTEERYDDVLIEISFGEGPPRTVVVPD
jgi:hypothetical protein